MSNLSELLPSGGGQNVVEFTASGTVASGKPVILNTNGTVTEVAETSASQDIPVINATSFEAQQSQYQQVKADPHNANRWAAVWTDDVGTKYVRVAIFTRSGSSITVSPTSNAYTSGNASEPAIEFDPDTSGKFILTFNNSSNDFSAIVGTFSGSAGSESFSYGSATTIDTSWQQGEPALFPTGTSGNFIAVAENKGTAYPNMRILTVSGTTVSAPGSTVTLSSQISGAKYAPDPNDKNSGIVLRHSTQASNRYLYGLPITISGTTISQGSETQLSASNEYESTYTYAKIAAVDSSKYLVIGGDNSNQRLYGFAFTISGGTITSYESSRTLISTTAFGSISYYDISNALSDPNTFAVGYRDRSFDIAYAVTGTVSGTTTSFGTPVGLASAGTTSALKYYYSIAQQTGSAGAFLLVGGDNSLNGRYVLGETGGTTTNLTATNFIGLASAAISDTAAGDINVKGGINEAQTGLTIGSDYYAQGDGTVSTTSTSPAVKIGQAISATTINMMDLT